MQFIQDLEAFAAKMNNILTAKGSLVISVPHPAQTAKNVKDYWQEIEYRQQIGKYGIYDMMIHRSLERYTSVFRDNGFVLIDLAEPKAERVLIEEHGGRIEDFATPKRLNMRFVSVSRIGTNQYGLRV